MPESTNEGPFPLAIQIPCGNDCSRPGGLRTARLLCGSRSDARPNLRYPRGPGSVAATIGNSRNFFVSVRLPGPEVNRVVLSALAVGRGGSVKGLTGPRR
jgi:hypothetical protein